MTLLSSRTNIDKIDASIVELLAKRFAEVMKIGRYKRSHGYSPLDEARRKTVLKSVISMAKKKGLSEKFITDVRERMHKETLSLQQTKKSA